MGAMAVGVEHDGVHLPAGRRRRRRRMAADTADAPQLGVPAAVAGGTTDVSLVLTALTGSVRVDDVFIDPWNRG